MAWIPADLTVADISDQFGPISLARIRTTPRPGSATEQDVVDIEAHEDLLFELYDGVLVEKAMGFYESYLAGLILQFLNEFIQKHDLGIAAGEAGMLKLLPGEVRIPDVSFISWDQLPNRKIPREPIPTLAPTLAVEVISKGNTPREMERKLSEYFSAGSRLVWYVYAESRSVHVFNSPTSQVRLDENQTLDGGDLLPGFELPLSRLFQTPDPRVE
jgi:Uma2 family endonuclease